MQLDDQLRLVREAVRAAGEVVMRHFRRDEEVHFKSPGQPVTAADLAADQLLRERLGRAYPGYGWLSEETADSADRLAHSRVWIVDPIDGTNSFVEGRPEFVVSVGLVEEGEPVLGVLLNPATGELYHAVRGQGAFRNDRQVRVAAGPVAAGRGIMLASRTELARGELDPYRDGWELMELGSTAYRMAKVADGTGHVFVSSGGKNEWDVCAAALIVHEAGGQVRQIDGGVLRFNQPAPEFRGIVATGVIPFQPQGAASGAPGEIFARRKDR